MCVSCGVPGEQRAALALHIHGHGARFPVGPTRSRPCCGHHSLCAWVARAPHCCRPGSQTAAAEGMCLRGPQIDTRQAIKKTYYAIIPLCACAARPCLLTGSKDAALQPDSSPPECNFPLREPAPQLCSALGQPVPDRAVDVPGPLQPGLLRAELQAVPAPGQRAVWAGVRRARSSHQACVHPLRQCPLVARMWCIHCASGNLVNVHVLHSISMPSFPCHVVENVLFFTRTLC